MWWKSFTSLSCLLYIATVSGQNVLHNGQDIYEINNNEALTVACRNFANAQILKAGDNRQRIMNECLLNNLGAFVQPAKHRSEVVVVQYTATSVIQPLVNTRSDADTRPKQQNVVPPSVGYPPARMGGGDFNDGGSGGNGGNGGGSAQGNGGGSGGGNRGDNRRGSGGANGGGKDGSFSQDGGNGLNGVDGYRVPASGFSAPSRPIAPIATTIRYGGEPEANTNTNLPPASTQKFTNNLYQLIAPNNQYKNVVYSPISLETLMALTYIGATGQTAYELRNALDLPDNRQAVLTQFGNLPKTQSSPSYQLDMANKLYYNQDLRVNQDFQQNAQQYFDADAERVRFNAPRQTAQTINQWVSHKTHSRIQNLIQPDTLDPQTSAILVNAIYFKAKWAKEFSTGDTEDDHFILSQRQKVPIAMMNNEDVFSYLDMPNIGASVIQLPYKDSDLSMLIILPYDTNGLAAVEANMRGVDLRQLPQQMQPETVKVQIPRFRVEFEMDMIPALKDLQIQRLFSDRAELKNIFNDQTAGISKVQHKAFLDVNEAGSEAAAATFNKLTPLSLPTNLKTFRADHPFMFAIVSPQAVYFMGHVVNL